MRKLFLILLLWPFFSEGQTPMRMLVQHVSSSGGGSAAADSTAFVTKVINGGGTLTTTEKSAIGTLIHQLRDSSLWDRMIAIYPMVGASSVSCAVNLKDTSKFIITWVNTPTFTSGGVNFNSVSAGNTNLLASTQMFLNDAHLSYYSTTNVNNTGSFEIGCNNPSTPVDRTYMGLQGSYAIGSSSGQSFTNADTRGLFLTSRINATSVSQYRNGGVVSTAALASAGLPSYSVAIGARNSGGSIGSYTNRNCAFASIGYGLTDAQAVTFYNIIQTFETALSRQV